ncbi:hypothetical protein [Rathayibacter sp. AY1C5]|uniref:hypothetical protein n=1 Tax=Rathayibacter sp. AY1C5 TaxID=2080538 RepID=UPI000CE80C34|nr:hypothetical protein [Rathayibacter sp. AY1C5]PPG60278.1 hypothetical protein C5C57_05610 [Rathayibacter sp. AY1C5]
MDSDLEHSIAAKFAGTSDQALVRRMERAEDFGYDDESVELTHRLKLGGLAWKWANVDVREKVQIYKEEEARDE